jgi:hypothetical protein
VVLQALFLLLVLLLLLKSHGHTWRRRLAILFVILFVVSGAAALLIAGKWGDFETGPIPAGTPVDLLANIKPHGAKKLGNIKELVDLLKEVKQARTDEERGMRARNWRRN